MMTTLERLVAILPVAICALILGMFSIAQEIPFNPSNQRVLSMENAGVQVSLLERQHCSTCPSVSRFIFRVKEGALTEKLVLENETAQIDEIHLTHTRKLIVVGRVLANTNIVTVFDVPTGQLLDAFFCFRPRVSPDYRFVSFVKVYPAHFAQNTSAQYLLYDLEIASEANRPSNVSLQNRIDVGLPVYPPGSQNVPGDNLSVRAGDRHTMASEAFYWTPSGDQFMFADRTGSQNFIVFVDVSNWPDTPTVKTLPLETDHVVNVRRCDEYKGRYEQSFHIVGATWNDDKEVLVNLRSPIPSCLQRQTLRLDPIK